MDVDKNKETSNTIFIDDINALNKILNYGKWAFITIM